MHKNVCLSNWIHHEKPKLLKEVFPERHPLVKDLTWSIRQGRNLWTVEQSVYIVWWCSSWDSRTSELEEAVRERTWALSCAVPYDTCNICDIRLLNIYSHVLSEYTKVCTWQMSPHVMPIICLCVGLSLANCVRFWMHCTPGRKRL